MKNKASVNVPAKAIPPTKEEKLQARVEALEAEVKKLNPKFQVPE